MTRESDDFDPDRRGLTAITVSFMVGLLFVLCHPGALAVRCFAACVLTVTLKLPDQG